MAPVGDVVDISSDEEDLFISTSLKLLDPLDPVKLARAIDDICGVTDYATGEDVDELMVMSEISAPPVLPKTANPDELVVMGELSSPSAPQQKKAGADGGRHEDDDDCVVLDGDPDKAVTVADEGSAGDGSSDELQIVAEKGPLACRDFPHSRHLCSNLPFSTTAHVKYCTMCHCFVCDAPAPCKYWGNSTSADDHCHATDKDSKWTGMRKIFKQNLLPASFPEKHQNGVYSTMAPPKQQPMQCHVSVPQLPSVSHGSRPSLSIQSHLLNQGNQRQQRHPSVRVSLSVGATVSSPRAGRVTGNAHIAQSTHSHAIFKRAGAVAPVFATKNASQLCPAPDDLLMQQGLSHASQPVQVAPTTNTFTGTSQNNHFQRSFSAPIAPEAQQGQAAGYYQVAINGMHATGPQLARSTSLTTQRTQFHSEPTLIDVGTSSWHDILATVASDLGVADYNMSTPVSQHVTVDSQTMHPTASHGFDIQHEAIAESGDFIYSVVHDSSNDTTGGSVRAGGSSQTHPTANHGFNLPHEVVAESENFIYTVVHDSSNDTTGSSVQAGSLQTHPTGNHGFNLQHEVVAESDNFIYSAVHDSSNDTTGSSVQAGGSLQTHTTANHGFNLQHEPIAESENFIYSVVNDSSNDTIGGSIQADGPMQTSESLGHVIGQSNPAPNEAHMNDFVGSPADELPIEEEEEEEEEAHEPEIPRVESTNILFEFDWD